MDGLLNKATGHRQRGNEVYVWSDSTFYLKTDKMWQRDIWWPFFLSVPRPTFPLNPHIVIYFTFLADLSKIKILTLNIVRHRKMFILVLTCVHVWSAAWEVMGDWPATHGESDRREDILSDCYQSIQPVRLSLQQGTPTEDHQRLAACLHHWASVGKFFFL